MKERVFKVHYYPVGYRVNKQLLISLQDIFDGYNKEYDMSLTVNCSNDTNYIFDSVEECFAYFETKPYKITKIEIDVNFGDKRDGNQIKISFDNSSHPSVEALFCFDNCDAYLLLKNKIEICLNNFKLPYRFLSRIPIMCFISTIGLLGICLYTAVKNIVYTDLVQCTILTIWLLSCAVSIFGLKKVKRSIFPCIEFWIGQNEIIEKRNSAIRNVVLGTFCGGIIIGVIVNYITSFLF